MYGLDTINSAWGAYCDHFHLYSWYYDNVVPQTASDSTDLLSVWAASMIGFPDACSYTDWLAIKTPVDVQTIMATTGDQFAWTCGFYVTIEWTGKDDVYFEIYTGNALNMLVSSLVLGLLAVGFY